jgi:hypothetical protein
LVTAAVVSRHSIAAASNQHQDGANKKLPHAVSIRSVSGEIAALAPAAWRYSPQSAAPNRNDLHALLVQAAFSDLGFIPTVLKIYLPSI